MNKLFLLLFLFFCGYSKAQTVTFKVTDIATGKPLPYATILYHYQNDILYADSSGQFSLLKDSLAINDSIYVQYLGYKKAVLAVSGLQKDNVVALTQSTEELKPVTVTNCKRFENYVVNKRPGKINNYLGPGPETKIIIMGRYISNDAKKGYVKQIEFYSGTFNEQVKVPVRLHWYEWDDERQMPGQDITATNIIIYPYKQGWNKFDLPANSLYFSPSGAVLGLEFIYPVEFMQQYTSLVATSEKNQWLMDMKHRWSLGMQSVNDEAQTGFYSVNNGALQKYNTRRKSNYIKPAVRFTISSCEEQ